MEDYKKFAIDELAFQYFESSLLKSFFEALTTEYQVVHDETEKVAWERYLLKAVGVQLDILGRILGLPRPIFDYGDSIFFGFDPDPTALGFGDVYDGNIGGRYRAVDEGLDTTRLLSDTEYRGFLFGRIAINSSNVTPDVCLRITSRILEYLVQGGENIRLQITEQTNAKFTLFIDSDLSPDIRNMLQFLDLVPRPAGVGLTITYP